jgi:hypothetical protein
LSPAQFAQSAALDTRIAQAGSGAVHSALPKPEILAALRFRCLQRDLASVVDLDARRAQDSSQGPAMIGVQPRLLAILKLAKGKHR